MSRPRVCPPSRWSIGRRSGTSISPVPVCALQASERTLIHISVVPPGNETMSHLYEPGNGRMTIMFEAFEGPPRILRLFGRGASPSLHSFAAKLISWAKARYSNVALLSTTSS